MSYTVWLLSSLSLLQGAREGRHLSILYITLCMPPIHGYGYSLFCNTISIISQLLGSSPFAGKGFYIAIIYGIFDFALHYPIKLYGFLQAFIVARCPEMFGQPIDSIRAAVSLLVRIQWGTVRFYQPIYASILRINEVVYETYVFRFFADYSMVAGYTFPASTVTRRQGFKR